MKRIVTFTLFLIITFNGKAQFFFEDTLGKYFYEQGSEYVNSGLYNLADSMFTLALCTYKNENVYYNRAVARLMLDDTIGFCEDLEYATFHFFDKEAESLFNEFCCLRIDTNYFDKSKAPTNDSKYRYYEITRSLKYDSIEYGSYHDVKAKGSITTVDFGCEEQLLGFNGMKTDIIAQFNIEDSVKYYFRLKEPAYIIDIKSVNALKREARRVFKSKYKEAFDIYEISNLTIYYRVYINELGEVVKISDFNFYPDLGNYIDYSAYFKELEEILNDYPKFKPALLFRNKVSFVAYDVIELGAKGIYQYSE